MELSKDAMNFGKFYWKWKVNMMEGKKAVKRGRKKYEKENKIIVTILNSY